MTPKSKLETLFHRAAEIADPIARKDFLQKACDGDELLRRQVEELLANDSPSGDFLPSPVLRSLASTSDHTPTPVEVGAQIGPYRLMEQIGEGGFGLVFVAEQQEPVRRKVALKVIKPGMDSRDVIARFEAERQALALMDHPHIAKVLDAGATSSGTPYFVMELVRGVPITEYCDQQQLSLRQRLELFVAVCRAVQHAHQKGIIHRDIKPSNVLVTLHDGKPIVKVIDFGIAKALHQRLTEKTIYTRFAQMIGTPLYMSPEQAEMSGLDVDTRSDIYSLGVLLYELLTGATPFDRRRLAEAAFDELRRIIREEEPLKPSTRVSKNTESLPTVAAQRRTEPKKLSQIFKGDLDWIVMKALEKDRTRRYETASGFASDVEHYLNDEPVEATPPTSNYLLRKWAKKHRTKLAIASLCAAALLVGMTGLGWGIFSATRSAAIAREDRDKAQKAEQSAKENEIKAKAEEAKAKVRGDETDALLTMFQFLAEEASGKVKEGETWRDRTFLEAVQNVEAKIPEHFKNQPAAEARFRTFIGSYYEQQSDTEKALLQRQLAYDLSRRVNGPAHMESLSYAQNLANAFYFQDEREKAIAVYKNAIADGVKILGPSNNLVEDLEVSLCSLAKSPEEILQAVQTLERIRERAKEKKGAKSLRYFMPSWYLAGVFARQKRWKEAAELYEELIGLAPSGVVEDGDQKATFPDLEAELADAYASDKQFGKAAAIYERLMAAKKKERGADHPDLIDGLQALLAHQLRAEKKEAAQDTLREVIAILQAAKEPNWYEVARMRFQLGSMLHKAENLDKAEQELRDALNIATEKKFESLIAECSLRLGRILLEQKKYKEAEPLFVTAYEKFQQSQLYFEMTADGGATPRDPQPHYDAADGLVSVYEGLGDSAELEKWKVTRDKHPKSVVSQPKAPAKPETAP
jgi:eukaryotic-like serine/threonine-protein kinase